MRLGRACAVNRVLQSYDLEVILDAPRWLNAKATADPRANGLFCRERLRRHWPIWRASMKCARLWPNLPGQPLPFIRKGSNDIGNATNRRYFDEMRVARMPEALKVRKMHTL